MKTTFLLFTLLIGLSVSAQDSGSMTLNQWSKLNLVTITAKEDGTVAITKKKLNEKQVIEKSHIDFTKECIAFTITGLIEIDGHTFLNDTCSHPIIYMADLEGVLLRDTVQMISYTPRKCEKPDCKVLHLEKRFNNTGLQLAIPSWSGTYNDIHTNIR